MPIGVVVVSSGVGVECLVPAGVVVAASGVEVECLVPIGVVVAASGVGVECMNLIYLNMLSTVKTVTTGQKLLLKPSMKRIILSIRRSTRVKC